MRTVTGDMIELDAFAMLDALPERVIRYRLSDLVVVYCNAVWAASYNLEPAQVVGRSLDQFLNEDGLVGLKSQLALLGPDNPVVLDCVARSDFSVPGVWVEWVDRYVSGPDGVEILAVGRDVTRRHIAESNLAASEARFRHLADNSADVVWRFASEPFSHFVYMSPSVEVILGYSPSYFLEDFTRILEILDDVSAGWPLLERSPASRCSSVLISGFVMPTARSSWVRHRPRYCLVVYKVSAATSQSCETFKPTSPISLCTIR
jgi:PAS domain-containing protein